MRAHVQTSRFTSSLPCCSDQMRAAAWGSAAITRWPMLGWHWFGNPRRCSFTMRTQKRDGTRGAAGAKLDQSPEPSPGDALSIAFDFDSVFQPALSRRPRQGQSALVEQGMGRGTSGWRVSPRRRRIPMDPECCRVLTRPGTSCSLGVTSRESPRSFWRQCPWRPLQRDARSD